MALVQRVPHRRIERGFHADDLDRWLFRVCGDGAAGNQAAAADRHHQHVEVGRIFQHLERDGALPSDDLRIVVRVDPDQIALGRDRLGAHLRFGDGLAVEDDGGAERFGRLDLHERGRHRHDDGRRNAEAAGMIGDRLRVIAG